MSAQKPEELDQLNSEVRLKGDAPLSDSASTVSGSVDKAAEEPGANVPAWFVIHCYSGYENKVRHNLEQRIETMGMKDKIFDVVVPTQEEVEVRDGKRRVLACAGRADGFFLREIRLSIAPGQAARWHQAANRAGYQRTRFASATRCRLKTLL